jgi:phosphohistidine phosphatase SixA
MQSVLSATQRPVGGDRVHLYLIRHACPREMTGDAPLGDIGIKQAERLGKLFASLNLPPESRIVISSPLQRARQTATLLCAGMGIADEVDIFPTLGMLPRANLKDRLMAHLAKITTEAGRSELIVVGHFDYLSESLAWLVGYDALSFPRDYAMTACLACKTSFQQGDGALAWLIKPELLLSETAEQKLS